MFSDVLVEMLYHILKAVVGCIAWQITRKVWEARDSKQKRQQTSGKGD